MTEVFIVYFAIQSFTLHFRIDWISMFETLIWSFYLVLPTFAAIYVGAITSEEVSVVFIIVIFFLSTHSFPPSINYQ